jgi:hypothetical protein
MDVESLRNQFCRLDPRFALSTLEEAEAWVRERGVVELTSCCSLPSLHVAVHEPPYKPGSRGFGLYPRTTWWWGGELAARDGLHALKIHRGKTVLVTTAVAGLADAAARAALTDAESGALGELEGRLVQHLAAAGPGEVSDLRAELDAPARAFHAARARLERLAALVSRPVVLEPHGHSSVLSRWDQAFPRASRGGLADLVAAFLHAAVAAPQPEIERWLSWRLPEGCVDDLVASGRLRRLENGLLTTTEV